MSKRVAKQVTWSVTLHSAGGKQWTYEIQADAKTPAGEVSRAAWVWHDRQGGEQIDPRKTEAEKLPLAGVGHSAAMTATTSTSSSAPGLNSRVTSTVVLVGGSPSK